MITLRKNFIGLKEYYNTCGSYNNEGELLHEIYNFNETCIWMMYYKPFYIQWTRKPTEDITEQLRQQMLSLCAEYQWRVEMEIKT